VAEMIFDIGMHNGNDTAYYLAKNYDVVAVEANPEWCKVAEKRFHDEIAAGRLIVHNVGIAEQDGTLEFWVSDYSEWSSFHKEQAARGGVAAHPVSVPTMRFADLLNKYPAALFAKIDIEQNDILCIRDLEQCSSLPTYVSSELSFEGTEAATNIQLLAKLGYREFKCIRQNDFREITPENMRWQGAMRKIMARAGSHRVPPTERGSLLLMVLQRLHYRLRRTNGWRFAGGSAGPLARELPGRWMSPDEMLVVLQNLRTLDAQLNVHGMGGEWFDIHAARH
jgi:FkbM family methyltransferase